MMDQKYAFEYKALYSLEEIQAVDPTAAVENDGEFGPAVFAVKEPTEYVFYPSGAGWTLDHTWHGFALTLAKKNKGGKVKDKSQLFDKDTLELIRLARDILSPSPGQSYIEGFGTVRVCKDCGCLVAGGPTRCIRCVKEGPPRYPLRDRLWFWWRSLFPMRVQVRMSARRTQRQQRGGGE
jgi:hypothetical protein